MAVLYRNHHDSIVLQGELVTRGIPYTVRSGLRFFEQAHIKDVLAYLRVVLEPARRGVVAADPACSCRGSARPRRRRSTSTLGRSADPLAALASAETMAAVPPKSKGLLRGVRGRPPADPGDRPGTPPRRGDRGDPQGGLSRDAPAEVRPRRRTGSPTSSSSPCWPPSTTASSGCSPSCSWPATSTAWTASRPPSPQDVLVLSTVHQAKGLEWSHVFVIRLIEESFPHRRALDEPGGEEEERRIFYVAVSRAMNELTLTYPSTITRGGYGPMVFTTPSRFLTELDEGLFERAELEHEFDLLEDVEDDDDQDRPAGRPSPWPRLHEPHPSAPSSAEKGPRDGRPKSER